MSLQMNRSWTPRSRPNERKNLSSVLRLAVLSHPQQPAHALVDLVDDREELVAPVPQGLVDADRSDPFEVAVLQAPAYGHRDRSEYTVPRRLEYLGHLRPANPLRPAGEEPGVRRRRLVLAAAPGHRLDHHAARVAVDPAHGVHEEHRDLPQRNELKTTRRQRVVPGSRASAPGASRPRVSPGTKLHIQHEALAILTQMGLCVDEGLVPLDPVEDSLQPYPVGGRGVDEIFRRDLIVSQTPQDAPPSPPPRLTSLPRPLILAHTP